ncbi:MAG: 16S rRNA (cytidine(1402)-2'-O)-methyltransferase [Clostridiales bacterium 38-18]|nr:MAG: 16S rRNA (cytidine(1402)-2'-O)-methyltransferase [Clostridiales bacterium 38-18]
MMGKLYLCGTPIGNLEDITFRALRILKEVDVVYAEDTRHSIRLLNHFEISKPLHSYHEHNQEKAGKEIIEKIKNGDQIALITDAGMPGISDPGHDLVKLCITEEIPFEVVPGVTAFTTALVGSGLPTDRFAFEGFLSRDKKQKKQILERIKRETRTLIFYESPHRFKDTLKQMFDILGEREVVVARELTKKFEEYRHGSFESLIAYYSENEIRGEIVLIVSGSAEGEEAEVSFDPEISIEAHVNSFVEGGMDKKEAMKKVAVLRGLKKSEVYKALL